MLFLWKLFVFQVFHRHPEHAEAFAVFLADVFVVHFVGTANASCVTAVGISEQFEPLVDENVVHHEIGQSVGKNPQSDRQPDFQDVILPQQEKTDADYSVKNEKGIVSLKPRIVVFPVMIGVQVPKEAVHDVFVAEPRHEFHDAECEQKDRDVNEPVHYNIFNL